MCGSGYVQVKLEQVEYNTCISTFQFDPEDAGKADKGPSRGAVHRTTLWGATDAESKVPSVENTELKGSFWGR